MKESRYIELLNLYVDHRLTPAEAVELEAEVQRSPERRRIYSQYCRMQKACAVLFDAERSLAPKTAAVLSSFDSHPRSSRMAPIWRWAVVPAMGLAAAIAFVAVLGTDRLSEFVRTKSGAGALAPEIAATRPDESGPAVLAQLAAGTNAHAIVTPVGAVLSETEVSIPPAVSDARAQESFRPSFKSFLARATTVIGRTAGNGSSSTHQVDLAWLNNVKLPPLNALSGQEAAFERQPVLARPETRIYRGREPMQGNVEMISFQFQR